MIQETNIGKLNGAIALFVVVLFLNACGSAELPNLIEVPSVEESLPTAEPQSSQPASTPDPGDFQDIEQESIELDNLARNKRGITDDAISIGIIKSGNVFQDVEVGVQARVFRLNENGGVNNRKIEIVDVVDDSGDPDLLLTAVEDFVNRDVFALILLSSAVSQESTDLLADNNMPFFGWGFSEGFCEPNKWGFGFNGCQNLSNSALADQTIDQSTMRLLSIFYGRVPQVISVTTGDPAGKAMTIQNERLWGNNLVKSLQLESNQITASYILGEIDEIEADVLLISVGLDETVAIKHELVMNFSGMVVDDVTYLPGILQDYEISAELEGGYVLSQIPPQEEYRGATTEIMTGLSQIDGPQIYSQAISVGYWSTDLLIAIIGSITDEFSVKSFFEKANIEGYLYDPQFSGGPCPLQTALSHQISSGGAALLQVRGGVFRPVINFNCPQN